MTTHRYSRGKTLVVGGVLRPPRSKAVFGVVLIQKRRQRYSRSHIIPATNNRCIAGEDCIRLERPQNQRPRIRFEPRPCAGRAGPVIGRRFPGRDLSRNSIYVLLYINIMILQRRDWSGATYRFLWFFMMRLTIFPKCLSFLRLSAMDISWRSDSRRSFR